VLVAVVPIVHPVVSVDQLVTMPLHAATGCVFMTVGVTEPVTRLVAVPVDAALAFIPVEPLATLLYSYPVTSPTAADVESVHVYVVGSDAPASFHHSSKLSVEYSLCARVHPVGPVLATAFAPCATNAMSLLPFVGVLPYVRTSDVDTADVPLAFVCTEDIVVNGGCKNAMQN
jgi:hypothetical protein